MSLYSSMASSIESAMVPSKSNTTCEITTAAGYHEARAAERRPALRLVAFLGAPNLVLRSMLLQSDHATSQSLRRRIHPVAWPTWVRWMAALIPPAVAFALEWEFYVAMAPILWTPFLLAITLTAWLGGFRATVVISAATALLVIY